MGMSLVHPLSSQGEGHARSALDTVMVGYAKVVWEYTHHLLDGSDYPIIQNFAALSASVKVHEC